jgi:homocysteine S-methyltransferase
MSDVLILDGALGTELERRGVATNESGWTSRANLTHTHLIREIHEEYIRAGATIITANTFRTNTRAHGASGLSARDLTRRAIGLAQQARKNCKASVQIAASIAPVEDCFSPELTPDDIEALVDEHSEFIKWLVEDGADILLIETMSTLRETKAILQAAEAVSNLPVIVSVVLKDARALLDGTPLPNAVEALASSDILCINCTPLDILNEASMEFASLSKLAGVPFGYYPNASKRLADGNWDLVASSDEEIAQSAMHWVELGASLVGSCCGTTPNTTKAISEFVHTYA